MNCEKRWKVGNYRKKSVILLKYCSFQKNIKNMSKTMFCWNSEQCR